jgi:hypothetical protein
VLNHAFAKKKNQEKKMAQSRWTLYYNVSFLYGRTSSWTAIARKGDGEWTFINPYIFEKIAPKVDIFIRHLCFIKDEVSFLVLLPTSCK